MGEGVDIRKGGDGNERSWVRENQKKDKYKKKGGEMRVNKKDKKRWKTETLLLLNALKFATYIRKMLFSELLKGAQA